MSYNIRKPKRKANRRKVKKNLSRKVSGLNNFSLHSPASNKGPVLYSSCASKYASFSGIPQTQTYVPDTEVLNAAFSYKPSVSLKELHDSGVFSSLEDSYEEKIDDEIPSSLDDEDFGSFLTKKSSWLEED